MRASPSWIDDVLHFWFEELDRAQWFKSSEQLDETVAVRFLDLLHTLRERSPDELVDTPRMALAAIIVLDQFSRNIFRGEADAFAQDDLAIRTAEAAVRAGYDQEISMQQRQFMYMPWMHTEDLARQERGLELFASLGDEKIMKFARDHRDIIAKFKRYPYRNEALGRVSTPEELDYLEDAKTYGQ